MYDILSTIITSQSNTFQLKKNRNKISIGSMILFEERRPKKQETMIGFHPIYHANLLHLPIIILLL